MNNLSWLLYIINVVESVGIFITFIWFALLVPLGIIGFGFIVSAHESGLQSEEATVMRRLFRKVLITELVISLIAVFIPNSTTMYMIAASEVTGTLLTSDTGKKIQVIINQKLDEEIAKIIKPDVTVTETK